MKNKIILTNLLVLFGYLVTVSFYSRIIIDPSNAVYNLLFVAASLMIIQIILNVTVSVALFVSGKNEEGKLYLVSAFLVALIGFPSCWGTVGLMAEIS